MTTSTTQNQTTDCSPRMPSQRDFEIFRLAVIKGFKHQELAGLFEISRRRVSQIVEDVRTWLSQHPCEDPNIATELQNKRLAQHLERMHLEDIINQARHEVSFGKRQLITTTEKADGTKTTTYREQPFNVQVLKTYLRAIEALGRLNARPEIPLPAPPEGEFPWIEAAHNEVYEKWHSRIWKGKLTPDQVFDFANEMTVEVLKAAKHQQELNARTPAEAADLLDPLYAGQPQPGDLDDDARKGDEGEAPAEVPTQGLTPAIDTLARSASEGNVLSTATPPGVNDAPTASLTSQREAPISMEPANGDEVATDSPPGTYVAPSPAETSDAPTESDPKNPKREASPLSFSPSLVPSVTPSTDPCPSPPGT